MTPKPPTFRERLRAIASKLEAYQVVTGRADPDIEYLRAYIRRFDEEIARADDTHYVTPAHERTDTVSTLHIIGEIGQLVVLFILTIDYAKRKWPQRTPKATP